jgi:hypothetical protein
VRQLEVAQARERAIDAGRSLMRLIDTLSVARRASRDMPARHLRDLVPVALQVDERREPRDDRRQLRHRVAANVERLEERQLLELVGQRRQRIAPQPQHAQRAQRADARPNHGDERVVLQRQNLQPIEAEHALRNDAQRLVRQNQIGRRRVVRSTSADTPMSPTMPPPLPSARCSSGRSPPSGAFSTV